MKANQCMSAVLKAQRLVPLILLATGSLKIMATKRAYDRAETNDEDVTLDCYNYDHFVTFSKSLPSQFVQVKPTVAYLDKGMTGFHEYTPQRRHAEIRVRRKYLRNVRRNECWVRHCVLLN